MFTFEDKPGSAPEGIVPDDIDKGSLLREKRLVHLKSILPYESHLKHTEVLSAQFHGLTLTVYGSKIIDLGDIIHYQKAKTIIPASPLNHFSEAAHSF